MMDRDIAYFFEVSDCTEIRARSIVPIMATARNIPVDWQLPPDLHTEYATNVLVQHGQHEIFLLFFQAQPPIIVGELVERQKQLEEISKIPAKCVAKVIISPDRLEELIDLLKRQLESYRTNFSNPKDSSE
jgi:hypothetical protein